MGSDLVKITDEISKFTLKCVESHLEQCFEGLPAHLEMKWYQYFELTVSSTVDARQMFDISVSIKTLAQTREVPTIIKVFLRQCVVEVKGVVGDIGEMLGDSEDPESASVQDLFRDSGLIV